MNVWTEFKLLLILYPMILVPGRVNGGLHVILTVEELMKEYDKPPTDDNGPVIVKIIIITCTIHSLLVLYLVLSV